MVWTKLHFIDQKDAIKNKISIKKILYFTCQATKFFYVNKHKVFPMFD